MSAGFNLASTLSKMRKSCIVFLSLSEKKIVVWLSFERGSGGMQLLRWHTTSCFISHVQGSQRRDGDTRSIPVRDGAGDSLFFGRFVEACGGRGRPSAYLTAAFELSVYRSNA